MDNPLTFNLERAKSNIAALAELRTDKPDIGILQQYSGWGGLREAVYQRDIYKQLKQLLNEADIQAIKSTFKTAYYTPEKLVHFIFNQLQQMQFQPKRILEPSAGHGVFLKAIPSSWQAEVTAVEMDNVSCRLLKSLYPNTTILHQRFEAFETNEHFDLILGNPPYGQIEVQDVNHPDLAACSIHHYFVGKCMRMLKEGGVLAMVLPRYFLDAPEKHVRHIIAKEGGSLLAAYRLPEDLFEDAKVTVDLVFLQKKSGNTDWIEAKPFTGDGKRAFLNTYFFQHPDKVLGKLEFIQVYGRHELSCKRGEDVWESLNTIFPSSSPSTITQSVDFKQCWKVLEEKLQVVTAKIQTLRKEEQQLFLLRESLIQQEQQLQVLCQQLTG